MRAWIITKTIIPMTLNTASSIRRAPTPPNTEFYVFRVKPPGTSLPPSAKDVWLAVSLTLIMNQCCFGMNCRGPPARWTSFTMTDTFFGDESTKLRDDEHITGKTIEQFCLFCFIINVH
jgi:hypothetical protein